MKIEIDFSKHISLGNVYDVSVVNNHDDFTQAQQLYELYSYEIKERIFNTAKLQPPLKNNDVFVVNIQSLKNVGFAKSLQFEVEETTETTLKVSLTKVIK